MISSRIVGGNEAARGTWPWMAAVIITRNNKSKLCGGSLITDQHILTAAHCVYK